MKTRFRLNILVLSMIICFALSAVFAQGATLKSNVNHPETTQIIPNCPPPKTQSLHSQEQALQLYKISPALFIENVGQFPDASVRFVHHGKGANIILTDSGPVFQVFGRTREEVQTHTFRATYEGAHLVRPKGVDPSHATFNYQIGADPTRWRTGVPTYEKIVYRELYPGIDLVVHGRRTQLKYDFHVAPGADYRQIKISYSGIDSLSLSKDGALRAHLPDGSCEFVDASPYAYQEIDGRHVGVPCEFELISPTSCTFRVTKNFDTNRELVIDPAVAWSTYLGGSDYEWGRAVAADNDGNVYVAGGTSSPGWVSGGYDTTASADSDAFVVKLSSQGAHLWSTYLGGSTENTTAYGMTLDSDGNVYVTGETSSSGWVSGGYNEDYSGFSDGFVAKVSSLGAHVWSTYVGGTSSDLSNGIALDESGAIYIVGGTYSSGWVLGGYGTSYAGGDGFVVKLTNQGGHVWSTYVGGTSWDFGEAIAIDASGYVYVTGATSSSGGWISGGYDPTRNGSTDCFVAKLDPEGTHVEWSTYIGGSVFDEGKGIAVDNSGGVYVTGDTGSADWPFMSGGWDTSFNGGSFDGFIVKLSDGGLHVWSTYLGGGSDDYGRDIVTDGANNVYVTGLTNSSGWVSGGFDTNHNGGEDAFVVNLDGDGRHVWSTYLGSTGDDSAEGIAANDMGNIYVTGYTFSAGWVSGGWHTVLTGDEDAFVAKLATRKGDFDFDGDVDFWDFISFIDVYELSAGDPGWEPKATIGDFGGDTVGSNIDGDVDFWDFIAFIDVYDT